MATIDFPTSPTTGQVYNANTKAWSYTGYGWKAISAASSIVAANTIVYTATAGQTSFTTPTYLQGANQVSIFINGVRQYPTEFTESTNTTITLTNGATLNDSVMVQVSGYTGNPIVIGLPTILDDTVTNATRYPLMAQATSGSLTLVNTASTDFTFNASTNVLYVPTVQFSDGTTITTSFTAAGTYANSAYAQANGASVYANGAFLQANAAFLQANTPDYVANSAALYANGAFTAANNALPKTGGTVTGNVTLSSTSSMIIQNTITSTTSTTGALIVSGGLGVSSNAYITGLLNITHTGFSGSQNVTATITSANTKGGVGYSDFLQVTNSSTGATNPSKYFRLNSTGGLEIINSAYTTNILSLTDGGNFTVPGSLTGGSTSLAASSNGLLITKSQSAVGTASTIKGVGNSPSFELLNFDNTQNWYFGINDADAKKLYIGRGYGPNQNVAPSLVINTSDSVGIGVASPTSYFHIKAGAAGASSAPLKLTSGTNLTTAEAGAVEYDGSFFYATPQTTNGRQVIDTPSYYILSADAAAVGSAIANFFPGTTSIPLVASGVYEIEFNCWFLKTTAGTLVWTLVNSTTVTKMHADMIMSPIAGVTSTNATSELMAQVANQTAASVAFAATGSLTTGVNHFMRMRVYLVNASSTSLRLQVTNSAGTVTPLGGSYWRATRIASVGTLA